METVAPGARLMGAGGELEGSGLRFTALYVVMIGVFAGLA